MKVEIKEGQKVNLKEGYPCIEKTIDVTYANYTFRLWIGIDDVPEYFDGHEKNIVGIIDIVWCENYSKNGGNIKEFVKQVAKSVPNLNAIQIKKGLAGVVVYLVDFENHG